MPNDLCKWNRDVIQISTGKPAARCECGNFHPMNHDIMETKTKIPPDDIKELERKKVIQFVKTSNFANEAVS